MYELREYQKQAVDAGIAFFRSAKPKNSIILMPTGAGKSLIIAGIVQALDAPCLILQPTKEILEQNIDKYRSYGYPASIYSASFNQKKISKVTFATVGSIIRKKEQFKDFKYVIVDECHGVNAKGGMYEEFLNFMNVPTLGLTATPYRLTTDRFGGSILKFLTRTRPRIFTQVIYAAQNKDLFDAGYLSKIEYVDIAGFDQSKIKINSTGADFDDDALKKYYQIINHNQRIIAVVNDLKSKRRGILVFTRFVAEAQAVADAVPGAKIVTAETPKKKRDKIVSYFRGGIIPVVTSAGVLSIGFDYPQLDTILLARPTMSLAFYYQMIGRGIRPHPDKEKALVVDLCENFKLFGKVEDLQFHDNGGLYYISNGDRQLTNVYYGDMPKPVATSLVMPFGKHKGTEISKIPKGYLHWLKDNVELKDPLKKQIYSVIGI